MSLALRDVGVIRSGRAILDRASLSCEPGRFTAFCGPNGAGKTTALSLLSGSLAPDAGEVFIDGAPLSALKPLELARRRAVVAQSSSLGFPFHVHEIVEMGRTPHAAVSTRARDSEAVAAAMEAMEIAELGARNYLTLSGGERQRVNIARALAQLWEPPEPGGHRWLLLDEPTSALDLRHQIALFALLRRLAREGWGIVAVLHDLHLVLEHVDDVVLFRSARIFATGPARRVLTPDAVQAAFGLDEPYALAAR
ncbi:MAG: heme ABC transporter ATP-binding protein [Erythrobacter sp.]|jgi:iron complex transport system ATP-binding protein|nr:heme ABC transporter ATP-binding protein [Erythrobacter sp.]